MNSVCRAKNKNFPIYREKKLLYIYKKNKKMKIRVKYKENNKMLRLRAEDLRGALVKLYKRGLTRHSIVSVRHEKA